MPVQYKNKAPKKVLLDVLREPYVALEDAKVLYHRIYEVVLEQLKEGKSVNLFNLVEVAPSFRAGHTARGIVNMETPDRIILKASVYPHLKTEWKAIQAEKVKKCRKKVSK